MEVRYGEGIATTSAPSCASARQAAPWHLGGPECRSLQGTVTSRLIGHSRAMAMPTSVVVAADLGVTGRFVQNCTLTQTDAVGGDDA